MISNLVPLVAMRASKVAAIREFERHFLRQRPRVPIAILRQPSGFQDVGCDPSQLLECCLIKLVTRFRTHVIER